MAAFTLCKQGVKWGLLMCKRARIETALLAFVVAAGTIVALGLMLNVFPTDKPAVSLWSAGDTLIPEQACVSAFAR